MNVRWATRISPDNLRPLASLFSEDLAIDLGTTHTRVYVRDRGIVINEPSAVALDDSTGEVQAVGKEAKQMLGRTPGKLRVIKPLKDGAIADFKVTEKMLSYFIQKAHQRRTLVHQRIVDSFHRYSRHALTLHPPAPLPGVATLAPVGTTGVER